MMKPMMILICLLVLCPGMAASEPPVCAHNRFSCLAQHMDDFYEADPERFYRVFNRVFDGAMRCKNYQDVARYLTLYSVPLDNAVIGESLQRDTEALLLLRPVCLFEGYKRLTPEQQNNFIGNYQFFMRPNHVMALLQHYMDEPKYRTVAMRLYQANQEAYQEYGKAEVDADMSELYKKYGRPH